jgi:hypothetical protein
MSINENNSVKAACYAGEITMTGAADNVRPAELVRLPCVRIQEWGAPLPPSQEAPSQEVLRMESAVGVFSQGPSPLLTDHPAGYGPPVGSQARAQGGMGISDSLPPVAWNTALELQAVPGLAGRLTPYSQASMNTAPALTQEDATGSAGTSSVTVNVSPLKEGEEVEPDKKNRTSLRALPRKRLEDMCRKRSTMLPGGRKVRWAIHGTKNILMDRLLGDHVEAIKEQSSDRGEKQRTGEEMPWPVEVKVMVLEELARLLRVRSCALGCMNLP